MEQIPVEYVNCNLCHANDTRTLYEWAESNIVICRQCGLIYRNPRRAQGWEMQRYSTDECRSDNTIYADFKSPIFKGYMRQIETMSERGKLIDIGCGFGEFLKIASEKEWVTQGVEVSGKCCRLASEKYGINVFKGALRQAHFPDRYFDVATLWDSLDIIYEPFEDLLEVRRILKPNGLVFIRVRNAKFHVNIKRVFRNSPAIVHIYCFSAATIRLMLKKAGFREIKVTNSMMTEDIPISRFLNPVLSLLNHINNTAAIIAPSLLAYARS